MFYIDSSKCTRCGVCVDVCPQRAISIYYDLAVINQELCIQCGTCTGICPIGAIYEVAPIPAIGGKQPYKMTLKYEGGDEMRGRGWLGRGFGWGYWGWGRGRGRGNPYPFCRFYPWLPRWWWATPYAGQYGATIPNMGYGYPYYSAYYPPYTPYRY